MARSLTFTKLTPRSNVTRYLASGADADNTCGRPSANADLQLTHLPDASAAIPGVDSLWSVVKTRLESNIKIGSLVDHLTQKSNLRSQRSVRAGDDAGSHARSVSWFPHTLTSNPVARSTFMKLDIYNLTNRSLLCHWNFKSPQEHHILLPNQPTNIKTPNRTSIMTLTAHQSISQRGQKDEIWLSTTSFSFKSRSRALWTVMELDESAPWIIYRSKVSHDQRPSP